MRLSVVLPVFFLSTPIFAQQIWDIWQTTWDRTKLFTSLHPSVIDFADPGAIGEADIVVSDSNEYQPMYGFGASLTDSSAKMLNSLKSASSSNYWSLLNTLFNPADGVAGAGMTVLRIPLGASDFSDTAYSFAMTSGDTSLSSFNLDNAPSYLWSVLRDIQSVNSLLKLFFVPWSPPAWMKDSGNMRGGSLLSQYYGTYANYLLKCLQALQARGFNAYAISIVNEPEYSTSTYPSAYMSVSTQATIGLNLRSLMNNNGFSGVKLIGYEHNWNDAGAYPVTLMDLASSAFAGVAFHCYSGSVSNQGAFQSRYPNKEVYFTECSGVIGSDWWSDIKWNQDNLFSGSGSVGYGSRTVMLWNLALDPNGNPKLPGTGSCADGCRPVVTISGSSWSLNQEYYLIAHSSRAIVPRDVGGPFGSRIGTSVGGTYYWALRVSAYVTRRASSSDWYRYSLVVLNWRDNASSGWNPQPVATTIEFRGQQARYTFPVGLTTLWWYAPANGFTEANSTAPVECASKGGQEEIPKDWVVLEDVPRQQQPLNF